METRQIKRGDLYYADLTPVIGSEQDGIRPVLIISNNAGNQYSPTVIVAVITSRAKKSALPTHCPIYVQQGLSTPRGKLRGDPGLGRDSLVMLEQIRTIDKERLHGYIGTLEGDAMRLVDAALVISVGLKKPGIV